MPRNFDSDSPTSPVCSFVEIVDCDSCGTTFEGFFTDQSGSLSFEDMTDPPAGTHTCPGCQRVFSTELTGWTFYSEAG